MPEPTTISKKTPESKSLQYRFLREEAIKYIQKLAGEIWTDYNLHDPGVTTLEILCYAITELGYRAGYPVKDLIAHNLPEAEKKKIRDFFTAREIFPNAPVSVNDYRKLLIDIDVYDPEDTECPHAGVKNAWIENAESNEMPVYVHKKESTLSYEADPLFVPTSFEKIQKPLNIGILYNILLEFDKCGAYGDLNENALKKSFAISGLPEDNPLKELRINVTANFPRWDNEEVNWNDTNSIKSNVQSILLHFLNVPTGYEFTYEIIDNAVKLEGIITTSTGTADIPELPEIESQINDFLYGETDSLLTFYVQKIEKIRAIIKEVKSALHRNRNLCEDFYKLSALKVEKIAVCADVELEREADVEEVQAKMYHEIGKFLSPTVLFHTLEEMVSKCRIQHDYPILDINTNLKLFTVQGNLKNLLSPKDTITITKSRSNDGKYNVKSLTVDTDANRTRINVEEDITSELLTEGEKLSFFTSEEEKCLTTDRIFEGPALKHGFIDDEELELAGRKKFIHVSDIIRIIMDVPGVVSVKEIQIANIPQDNEDGAIESKSVKWCLELAFDQKYVPRLSTDDSKITFYKEQLPFRASSTKVMALINELEKKERPQKLYNPVLDFEVPEGTWRDLESFESIQNEFPLTYGIGEEGFPTLGNNPGANKKRAAQAKQFKGYLMVFDQLLANYFSQLAHVKELFSMNAEKDEAGNFLINMTYFTQPLFNIVPNSDALFLNKDGHQLRLNNITEDKELFYARRNKFLDHLTGRFAENFTDYALLTLKLSGKKKGLHELIEDKLAFLNAYPLISSARGQGFDHQSPCKIWHVDNISGLQRRVSYLGGIDQRDAGTLHFNSNFSIVENAGGYQIHVTDNSFTLLLKSYEVLESEEAAKLMLEEMIINGISKENYLIHTGAGGLSHFTLMCGEEKILAISERIDYNGLSPGDHPGEDIDTLTELFRNEFYFNTESNRNNLASPLFNYLFYSVSIEMEPDPPVAIVHYSLYKNPLTFEASDRILTGQYPVKGSAKSEVDIISVDIASKTIVIDGNIASKLTVGDLLIIEGSQDNDGTYTVQSAVDAGENTDISVIESIPSDNLPLGELLYNNDSAEELEAKAEEMGFQILWQLINKAARKSNYYFSSESGAYRFRIFNSYGEDIAESVASDFNNILKEEVSHLPSGQIHITGSPDNDGAYEVMTVEANGPEVTITINTTFPSNGAGGQLMIHEAYEFSSQHENRRFIVVADLTEILSAGDTISISGSEKIDGNYTIGAIGFNGAETIITVKENIPFSEDTGNLTWQKKFPVKKFEDDKVTIEGGQGIKAVEQLIDFITETFFSHEGFHVVEHLLLRPKVKGMYPNDPEESYFEDQLLNIVLDESKCDACKIEDPYTCVATIVLPHWQGRFNNQDFRRFFERQIRMETPAHVFLNFCWISCEQMHKFEGKFKAWLVENAKTNKDYGKLSTCQNELLDTFKTLRNVYPSGTLYDCEKHETLENAIILDYSMLGSG